MNFTTTAPRKLLMYRMVLASGIKTRGMSLGPFISDERKQQLLEKHQARLEHNARAIRAEVEYYTETCQ